MSDSWLSSLKQGDKVIVQRRSIEDICTVERITPTGIIKLNNRLQFDKHGRERGAGYGWTHWLRELTDEKRAEFEHRNLAQRVSKIDWSKCSADQLRRIKAITEEDKGDARMAEMDSPNSVVDSGADGP